MPKAAHKVVVIGHRNPDTDSICSAIAYAELKNKTSDLVCEARRAGRMNQETEFVLKKFGVTPPRMCTDVNPKIRDVDYREMPGIPGATSLRRAWEIMRDQKIDTLPITSAENDLEGIITVKDIATANMDVFDTGVLAKSQTSFRNILETLGGTMVVGDENAVCTTGHIKIGTATPEMLESNVEKGDIVILTNRYESQLCAIEKEASLLIICNGAKVGRTIQRIAEETGVTYMGNEGAIHWLHEWTGLAFPENADSSRWTRLPEVQALAKDPVRALKELPAGGQTSTNGGYRVTAAGMTGGQWFQNRRDLPGWPGARTVRRPATGHDTLSAVFELKPSETGAARLVVCAHGNYRRADDNVEPIRVELAVNDRTIYVGATPFSAEGMRERAFAIPAGVLRPGRNLVRLRNTTPNETGADVAQTARKNHYRGWVDVESMNLEPGR